MVNVMEKEQILGQVVKFTLVNIKMIKDMVRIMLQVPEFLGQGKSVYANGDSYEGGYENDNRSGHGKYSWKDGRTRVGPWKDHKEHGEMIFTSTTGATTRELYENGVFVRNLD